MADLVPCTAMPLSHDVATQALNVTAQLLQERSVWKLRLASCDNFRSAKRWNPADRVSWNRGGRWWCQSGVCPPFVSMCPLAARCTNMAALVTVSPHYTEWWGEEVAVSREEDLSWCPCPVGR